MKTSILSTHCTLTKNFFSKNKFSSPYSATAKCALDSSYLHDRIFNHDPLNDYFIHYSQTNPKPLTDFLLSHAKFFEHMTLIPM